MNSTRVLFRFLIGYLILHLLMAAVFVLVLTRVTRNQQITVAQSEMNSLAVMLREHINGLPAGLQSDSLIDYVMRLGDETQFRYTLIDHDGRVLVDSVKGTEDIGPHGNRQEVKQAYANGFGFVERFSKTLQQQMMYLAVPYYPESETGTPVGPGKPGSGIIRVSTPATLINESIVNLQKSIWLFAFFLLILTVTLMSVFSFRTIQPLKLFADAARRVGAGKLNEPLSLSNRNDEWQELAVAFGQMQDELANRESRLLENNQRVQAVLSSMIEGVLSTSSDDSVLMANDAACEMLSLDRSELIGKKLLDVIRFPEFRKAIERARANRSFSESEFEVFEPRRIIKARVSTLSNDPELGVAIVLHDVSEIRALENMRRDFVANVSHELKTPLSSIKAYSETLRLGAIHNTDKALPFVEQIESQAEVLHSQIQDLIELAKIESGKASSDIINVDFNEVCLQALEQFESQSRKRNVNLTCQLAKRPVIGRANPDGIRTILNNLVSNALHYTLDGGNVVMRTRREQNTAIIEVSDTGIGIASDQQDRVFERFYRVDKARSRDMGGTGLGLSIVKHLTQSFSGSCHLSSQIGKGSTFQIRIPSGASTH